MNAYCGLRRIDKDDDNFCSHCAHYSNWVCEHPCQAFLDYLSLLSECLKGHPIGKDPCYNCPDKGEWNCPLYGPERYYFETHRDSLNEEIGGIKEG